MNKYKLKETLLSDDERSYFVLEDGRKIKCRADFVRGIQGELRKRSVCEHKTDDGNVLAYSYYGHMHLMADIKMEDVDTFVQHNLKNRVERAWFAVALWHVLRYKKMKPAMSVADNLRTYLYTLQFPPLSSRGRVR